MAAQKREPNPSVEQRLFEAAWGFSFFKAVHLLEGLTGGTAPGCGLSPQADPVRFKVPPGFAFPASDIAAMDKGPAGLRMMVNFMGLVGPKGVLPDWYNEHALQRCHKGDHAFTDFLDMFHQRLLSLFYRAWKKYRLAENYRADGSDPISGGLAQLVGMDRGELQRAPRFYRFGRNPLIYFSGLVSRIVPTSACIVSVITAVIGAPVAVEQFVPRMIPVDPGDRTCLGQNNSTLKKDALCGGRVQEIGTYFIVRIGPLDWKTYLRFQPRSENLFLIRQMIARLAGITYEFDIHLIIMGSEFPSLSLGGRCGAPLLGRTVLLRNTQSPYRQDIVVTCRENNAS